MRAETKFVLKTDARLLTFTLREICFASNQYFKNVYNFLIIFPESGLPRSV